ncbi:MAG: histidine-type phosphatase [Bacteroidales bacterium]|nr:histidine-type phosphatase [Bacteroidales bacterium]
MILAGLLILCMMPGILAACSVESTESTSKANGLYYVYDYKEDKPLTPAPAGYKPFYISHFARHGARYCEVEYDSLYIWLSRAENAGELTQYGKDFQARYEPFYQTVKYRKGNLTGIGKDQHRTIGKRMYSRFPEVFKGNTRVEAVSTTVPRVIMSMWSCLSGLQEVDSSLQLNADASSEYIFWLNPLLEENPNQIKGRPRYNSATALAHAAYCRETVPWEEIAEKFFTSPEVLEKTLGTKPEHFIKRLHAVVSGTWCLDHDRGLFDDVLTEEQKYACWRSVCAGNFILLANYEGSDNLTCDFAAYTLENIISLADSDIASGDTQLRLRFGHDSGLMALLAFMDVNGFGHPASSMDQAITILPNYNVPMGASLQFVFYRNRKGDIIFKILLNEEEAYLPIPAADGPYYNWNAFREYYLPRIAASKDKIAQIHQLQTL